MSEGYTIETRTGVIAGIVVRWKGERGFRFHAADMKFHALDGHIFATPAAAERAASDHAAKRPAAASAAA
jgi:hypothetical protein